MIAGLDIGTSNCKISVYDGGTLIAQASAAYTATRSAERHSLDAEAVWSAVKSLFRQAIAACPAAAGMRAIAVSTLGEAAIPVDGEGRTLGEALLFWDPSGREEAAGIVEKLGREAMEAITGVIPDPMYTLCKMAWLKKHAAWYKEAKHFFLFEDFIIYRLTGRRALSYSLAGRTMAFDIEAKNWSQALFQAAGIDPALMSPTVPSGTPVGGILPSMRKEFGLTGETLVITGGHDQMCVAVGAGAIRPGIASNGSGTVEVLAVTVPDDVDRQALYADNYTLSVHAEPARLFTYSCNSTGSLLLNWYIKTFGDASSASPFADFESCAPAEPTPLLTLPYVAGTGTPFMDLGAAGGFFGLTLGTDKYALYRSLMEGLTYDLAHNMARMARAGVAVTELRCTGGGSLSRMWLQIKADVTGVPVRTLESHQAGALGCMALAATAAGEFGSITEAVGALVKTKEVFEPNMRNHAFYRERLGRFVELYEKTRPLLGARATFSETR